MAYQFPPDVDRLVRKQMTTKRFSSEDELLRRALELLEQFAYSQAEITDEYQQTVSAVREGIQDMECGRMHALSDLITDARKNKSQEIK